jgi:predicted DNA-binding protein with PD1-like motif
MQSKLLTETGPKTWAVVFETGDEFMAGLARFAADQQLDASQLTAIGAFERATLGYFDMQKKDYTRIPVDEQVEVLALVGDITDDKDGTAPKIHAHVVVGRADGSTRGWHILEAWVRPTLEVIVSEAPRHLRRKTDPATGLALIEL